MTKKDPENNSFRLLKREIREEGEGPSIANSSTCDLCHRMFETTCSLDRNNSATIAFKTIVLLFFANVVKHGLSKEDGGQDHHQAQHQKAGVCLDESSKASI